MCEIVDLEKYKQLRANNDLTSIFTGDQNELDEIAKEITDRYLNKLKGTQLF